MQGNFDIFIISKTVGEIILRISTKLSLRLTRGVKCSHMIVRKKIEDNTQSGLQEKCSMLNVLQQEQNIDSIADYFNYPCFMDHES